MNGLEEREEDGNNKQVRIFYMTILVMATNKARRLILIEMGVTGTHLLWCEMPRRGEVPLN
jgi:hypothetical protein